MAIPTDAERYSTTYSKNAIRTMQKLPNNIRNKIDTKVSALAANPMASNKNVTPLKGLPGSRLRVGDWRVSFEIDHSQRWLHVSHVGPRGEDYKP